MQSVRGPDRAPTGGKRRTAVLLPAAVAALAVALLAAAAAARAQAGGAPAAAFRSGRAGDAHPLDDQTPARQRGRAVGMVAVAVAPPLPRNSGVTLWDELAPPAPLPVPIDAAQQAAQRNVASYTRK